MGSLEREVESFREWAATRQDDAGEWETEYEGWPALRLATNSALSEDRLADADIDHLLFVLARDNECEAVRELLEDHVENGMRLAVAAIEYPDRNARWQVAAFLGTQDGDRARTLLRLLLVDPDEYVRRRALLACAQNDPGLAEATAAEWLSSEAPYTRLAALAVLHETGSPRLASAIARLRDDPADFVRTKAREIGRVL